MLSNVGKKKLHPQNQSSTNPIEVKALEHQAQAAIDLKTIHIFEVSSNLHYKFEKKSNNYYSSGEQNCLIQLLLFFGKNMVLP